MRDTSTTKYKDVNHWLMLDLIERKVRLHMQRIYEECGHAEGREMEDWLKAQSEALRTFNSETVRPAKKRTKFDKLQRNVERLARRDAACRERSAINEDRPEPAKRKAMAA